MKRGKKIYSIFQLASALFMILALLWLTVSAPFVYASQQELSKQNKVSNSQSPLDCNDEESSNPFGNSTEEKAPGNSSLSEEYLHHHHHPEDYFTSISSQYHKGENADTYIAFHGEVQVPPPNAA
ncbi:MAG TPA: hypothetical protein VM884_02870 [Flavisolibacter sp.]|jgi:hypothetical protein|nr:hypothetical protein [Flavisolibacter sp.]